MNDLELTRALSALADDHEPEEVDVDHIRTTFALRRRRRYAVAGTAVGVAVLVTGLIVATRSVAANHTAPPAVTPAPGHWVQYGVTGLDPADSALLRRVTAISDTDAWAVGAEYGPGKSLAHQRNLAAHWDGREWRPVDVPGGVGLSDVAAITADDVWAVGTGQNGAGGYTAHWNGHDWTEVTSPTPDETAIHPTTLFAVSAVGADDVWAVGCSADGGAVPVIQHWNGHAWTNSPLPTLPVAGFGCLDGVSAVATDDVWAVGHALQNQQPIPLALHWNGRQWSIVQTAGPFGPATVGGFDNVIALSSTDVWAFGGYVEFAQHWDGRQWTHVPGPSDSDFQATADAPDGRGGLVTSTLPEGRRTTLNVFSWDGKTWTDHPGPPLPGGKATGQLYGFGVAPGSHRLWAVGFAMTNGRTQHPLISLTGIR